MKSIIKLTESDLTRIVRRVIKEQDEKNDFFKDTPTPLNQEQWEKVWMDLRKENGYKGFYYPDKYSFDFGGLNFYFNPNTGMLHLPPQKLSDWRDDTLRAREILDNYVERLREAFERSEYDLKMYVSSNYEMKIYFVEE